MGIKVTNLNIVKPIYDRLTANIIPNGEKPKAFHLKSGTRQGTHCDHDYSTVLEILGTAIRKGKEIKSRLEKRNENSHCLQMT